MKAYICKVCGYLYDIESADKDIEGNPIPFEELNETDWKCPICGTPKAFFKETYSTRPPDIPTK